MTMTPERLANYKLRIPLMRPDMSKAATELVAEIDRLNAENEQLREQLESMSHRYEAEIKRLVTMLNDVCCCNCAVGLGPGSDTNSDLWCDECAAGDTAKQLENAREEIKQLKAEKLKLRDNWDKDGRALVKAVKELEELRLCRRCVISATKQEPRSSGYGPRTCAAEQGESDD